MHALASFARTWPMLSALGAGLVLLAVAAGAGGVTGAILAGAGVVGLGWAVFSLRSGRALAPGATLLASAGSLVAVGALVGTGLAANTDVAAGPLLAASVFVAVVGGHAALLVRRRARTRAAQPTPDAERPTAGDRTQLVGLVAGALLVAALATPALAATEAGEFAVPHGQHGSTGGHH